MSKSFGKGSSGLGVLLLLLLAGGLAGSAVGNALAPALPWLKASSTIGLKPFTLDLQFFSMTFGFTFNLSLLTALGFFLGYIIYKRV
ncbi:MAG: hypothetical protein A4E53_02288 [Pelotomaculum sp. PtaB.Bin104]|nr:MAG: hypothetical protein A4E53_02288 [Pelotomaculum sp. PtaB.Bin104]